MPLSKYNKILTSDKGDSKGASKKLMANLVKEYGDKKGKQVFYGIVAKRERAHGN
jgi:hypothetical protein